MVLGPRLSTTHMSVSYTHPFIMFHLTFIMSHLYNVSPQARACGLEEAKNDMINCSHAAMRTAPQLLSRCRVRGLPLRRRMSQLPLALWVAVAVARISWHRRHTRSHNNNDGNRADGESDAGDGLGNTAADNSVRWRLFKEWTHNEWSCLGCYLLCALNRPIRDILMFIFLYSDGHTMDEQKFRQKYMFDREELERRKRCIAKGDTGFIEGCSGRPTGAGARPRY